MAVAICTDGGKGNGNIGGKKKHWQMRGWGKSTGGKFNGEISAAGKSPWQHTWQRKGQLALRAKALATQVAKLWQKLWQGLKTGRESGKSLGKANREGTLHGHIILYAAVGLHKRLLNCAIYKARDHFQWCDMIKLRA